jgi:hypothetical protein
MTNAIDFFQELDFKLPEPFIHRAVYPIETEEPIIWGPFMAILLNLRSDQSERVSEWLRRSDELVEFIRKANNGPGFEIEWWTHRQHIFEVTEKPVVEYGILKLRNEPAETELWIRNLNVREDHIQI